jgi:hypothetical protein
VTGTADIRRFFTGVLGWTPRTVREEASLADLAEAFAGFAAWHGLTAPEMTLPAAGFLEDMLKKYPDERQRP